MRAGWPAVLPRGPAAATGKHGERVWQRQLCRRGRLAGCWLLPLPPPAAAAAAGATPTPSHSGQRDRPSVIYLTLWGAAQLRRALAGDRRALEESDRERRPWAQAKLIECGACWAAARSQGCADWREGAGARAVVTTLANLACTRCLQAHFELPIAVVIAQDQLISSSSLPVPAGRASSMAAASTSRLRPPSPPLLQRRPASAPCVAAPSRPPPRRAASAAAAANGNGTGAAAPLQPDALRSQSSLGDLSLHPDVAGEELLLSEDEALDTVVPSDEELERQQAAAAAAAGGDGSGPSEVVASLQAEVAELRSLLIAQARLVQSQQRHIQVGAGACGAWAAGATASASVTHLVPAY